MKPQRAEPTRRRTPTPADVVEEATVEEPDADLLAHIDDLLDEIDAVLEDQAILAAFRQMPGQ